MLGGVFSLLTSVYAADTTYLVLVSISGLAVVFVWMAIALCQLKFRQKWLKEGNTEDELKFKTPPLSFHALVCLYRQPGLLPFDLF